MEMMLNTRQKSFTSRAVLAPIIRLHFAKCVHILSRISAENTCRDIKARALNVIYFPWHNITDPSVSSFTTSRSFLCPFMNVRFYGWWKSYEAGSFHSLHFDEFTDTHRAPLTRWHSLRLCRTLTWTSSSSCSLPSSIGLPCFVYFNLFIHSICNSPADAYPAFAQVIFAINRFHVILFGFHL